MSRRRNTLPEPAWDEPILIFARLAPTAPTTLCAKGRIGQCSGSEEEESPSLELRVQFAPHGAFVVAHMELAGRIAEEKERQAAGARTRREMARDFILGRRAGSIRANDHVAVRNSRLCGRLPRPSSTRPAPVAFGHVLRRGTQDLQRLGQTGI